LDAAALRRRTDPAALGFAPTDLLVMDCYGHSCLRELMLGGATRSVLGAMDLPVLMSH
jgi:nucleotide-binding universal stress UspA family protein